MSNTYYLEKIEDLKKDDRQLEAYESNSNTVVIAGPGSGKTTVLTLKIVKTLQTINQPRGVACITFSRASAKELSLRLTQLGINRKNRNVFIGTVHAFCISEIITPFAHLFRQYNIPEKISIISEKDRKKVFDEVVEQFEFVNTKVTIEEMDKERSLNINGLSEVKIESHEVALNVAKIFEERLREMKKMDFLDVVKYSTLLIQREQYVRRCLEAKYPWIFIDEYQDLGKPLHEMILSLYNQTSINFFAVGDPDQSIYGFNGAVPDFLNELSSKSHFKTVKLKSNYRSTQQIVDTTEFILDLKEKRIAKGNIPGNTEFNFIVCDEELDDQYNQVIYGIIPKCRELGIPYEEIAVLMPNNKSVIDLSKMFKYAGIPYYLNNMILFDRSEIIIWLEKCASWVKDSYTEKYESIFEFWAKLLRDHGRKLDKRSLQIERIKLFETLKMSKRFECKLSYWLEYIYEELDLIELFSNSDFHSEEAENLLTLLKISMKGEFSDFAIDRFASLGKPNDQVTISTRHSSKGLEFEVVIVLGMEEDHFPSYYAKQNERELKEAYRLFYVCISRAKRICYLIRSLKYTKNTRYGRKTFDYNPSRFWNMLYEKFGENALE